MSGSASPCGACKFLRRKCVKGCVFGPYFSHEQGATHFSAIHKVFGASNVSKLLAHLPLSHRCQAAATIAYEAQARLQDPIYGCVSHIFALQQQVVNLQSQLASLKEQASQCLNGSNNTGNPSDQFQEEGNSFRQDIETWFQDHGTMPQFYANMNNNMSSEMMCPQRNMVMKCENTGFAEQNMSSYGGMEMQSNESRQWAYQNDIDDLLSVAFRYIQHS